MDRAPPARGGRGARAAGRAGRHGALPRRLAAAARRAGAHARAPPRRRAARSRRRRGARDRALVPARRAHGDRAAAILVATPRAMDALRGSGVELDVLVASATDAGERIDAADLRPPPRHIVLTEGAEGGTWKGVDGRTGRWKAVAPPGAPVDSYGSGDSFAAGLAYGLGAGMSLDDALETAARCGAWCLTGRGPYGNQFTLA